MLVSRRQAVMGGLAGCLGGAAQAKRLPPASMQPLIGAGYGPRDADEKGLWQDFERLERETARSPLLVQAPAFRAYIMDVVTRLIGERARDVRAYLVRDPDFNASMAPNGMLVVHTGLLIRMRTEAQFAAVLGHEAGHYLRRHSLEGWRDQRRKSGAIAFISAGATVAAGATAMAGGNPRGWIDLANSVNQSLALSLFSFSREHEREADAFGLRLIDEAGYPPAAASEVWRQLIQERRASAVARDKRYRDAAETATSTHPPSMDRMVELDLSAQDLEAAAPDRPRDDRRAVWRTALAPLRPQLLDELVKQNDPGASLYLIEAQAADGWDGVLRFHQGEAYRLRDGLGDATRAADAYAAAVALPDAPAEAWRQHGYALFKVGRREDGRAALARYLGLRPDAGDAAMFRFAMGG
jgi:predicted Zn-dependent protease